MDRNKLRISRIVGLVRLFGLWTLVLVAISVTTACNSAGKNLEPEWSASLNYSGGFAGIMHSITLDHTGLAVFSDNKLKTKIEKMLEPDHLQVFAKLVKILPGREVANNRSKQCRDCINYSLVVVYDGISKRRKTDNLALQASDARELISKLKTLAAELGREK